jgi:hypothetical protein
MAAALDGEAVAAGAVEGAMNRVRLRGACGLLLLFGWLVGPSTGAAPEPAAQLLRGELWQRMSYDTKVAYVWGIGNLVEFDAPFRSRSPQRPRASSPI